jgi:hypothetical protein
MTSNIVHDDLPQLNAKVTLGEGPPWNPAAISYDTSEWEHLSSWISVIAPLLWT